MQLERQGDERYIDAVKQPKEIDMIYAVNKRTKEHRVVGPHSAILMRDYDIVPADADGWIEWGSDKECPLPNGSQCEVRIGTRYAYARVTDTESLTWREVRAYRPILDDKPQTPEWNSEGLPPVGAVCEVSLDFSAPKSCANWSVIEVMYTDRSTVVGRIIEGSDFLAYSNGFEVGLYKFRPLRTDREKWIDAAHDAGGYNDNDLVRKVASQIYDALKSGELPQP